MGYGDEELRRVFSKKIWTRAEQGLLNLKKFDPLALPFYASLHAMVINKRRIMDNDYFKIRIKNDKIEFWENVDSTARDTDKQTLKWRMNSRRDFIKDADSVRIYGDDMAFFEDLADGGHEYKMQLEPDTRDFTQRFDKWICAMDKIDYKPLSTEFESDVSKTEPLVAKAISGIAPPGTSIEVNARNNRIEIELTLERREDDEESNEMSVQCKYEIRYNLSDTTKELTFATIEVTARDDVASLYSIPEASKLAPEIVKIVTHEIIALYETTKRKNKKHVETMARLDSELVAFEKEATALYEKYYKASVEEISGAQELGVIMG